MFPYIRTILNLQLKNNLIYWFYIYFYIFDTHICKACNFIINLIKIKQELNFKNLTHMKAV